MLVAISLKAIASESLNIGKLQGGILLGQWEHEFLWCDAWFAFLSEKDTKHPLLKGFDSPFTFWLYLFLMIINVNKMLF